MRVDLDRETIGQFGAQVDRVVFVGDPVVDLTARQRLLKPTNRHEGRCTRIAAPTVRCVDDIARLEQPGVVIEEVGEPADRALRARSGVTRRPIGVDPGRAIGILKAADRIGLILGQIGRGLKGVLAPLVG